MGWFSSFQVTLQPLISNKCLLEGCRFAALEWRDQVSPIFRRFFRADNANPEAGLSPAGSRENFAHYRFPNANPA